MVIFKDLFWQKEERDKRDYLFYDYIPKTTRQKISFVIHDYAFVGDPFKPTIKKDVFLGELRNWISKHRGTPNINQRTSNLLSINDWLTGCSLKEFIRSIEIFLELRERCDSQYSEIKSEEARQQINDVFDIDKIGYEIVECRIRRRDDSYLHRETIKKTMSLLKNYSFQGPLEEFESALDKYLEKDYKGAIVEANNAYESVMKSILTKLNVSFEDHPANRLIKKIYDTELIDLANEDFANNLKQILVGLPTIRNKKAGHGQGIENKKVDKSYAEFALHLCGSFIVFLIHRYEEYLSENSAGRR